MNGQVPYVESQVNMSRYMYPATNSYCHSPPLLPQPGALPYNQVLLACCNVSRSMRRRLPFQMRGTRTRRMRPTRMGAVWGDSSRKERARVFNRCSFRCLRRGTKVENGCSVSFQIGRACGQACTIRIPQNESACSLRLERRRACTRRGTWSFLCSPPSRNWQRSNSSETKWTASFPLNPALPWTVGRTWEWLALMMTSTRFVCLSSSRCGQRRT